MEGDGDVLSMSRTIWSAASGVPASLNLSANASALYSVYQIVNYFVYTQGVAINLHPLNQEGECPFLPGLCSASG